MCGIGLISKAPEVVPSFTVTNHVCTSVPFSSVVNILYFFIDWVDVANDLLRSCHINQHIKHLSECGADVFVHLYESILGEKVPDFIATPRSQEDDAHNVQAVIDSLALDYLQVSLSHITEHCERRKGVYQKPPRNI
uniref:DUF5745 domain-containing protein n=1 Tax=Pavo cristatus TaxID=9049 RepID=A0A8C9LGP6_PAVCR